MGNAMQKVDIAQRRALVAKARLEGYRSSREIADWLEAQHGISVHHTTVNNDINWIAQDLEATTRSTAERERALSLQRNEDIIKRLYRELDKLDVAEAAGAASYELESRLPILRQLREADESRRKMLGLNSPSKIAHTDPSGSREAQGGSKIPASFWERARKQGLLDDEPEVIEAEIVE